jgi:hypothetical protein
MNVNIVLVPDPNGSKRRLKVFLCHSSRDKDAVRELHKQLTAAWVDPWLDEKDIRAGQDWDREIRRAVRRSDVVVVCLSRASTTAEGYVQKELKYALDAADEKPEGTIYFIPLKLEQCDIPERLAKLHCVNYFNDGLEPLLAALSERATDLRRQLPKSDAGKVSRQELQSEPISPQTPRRIAKHRGKWIALAIAVLVMTGTGTIIYQEHSSLSKYSR